MEYPSKVLLWRVGQTVWLAAKRSFFSGLLIFPELAFVKRARNPTSQLEPAAARDGGSKMADDCTHHATLRRENPAAPEFF
jgi:hypothetical protein